MSRLAVADALAGRTAGFVCGLTWLSSDIVSVLVDEEGSIPPAEALASIAAAADTDFVFVSAGESRAAEAAGILAAADIATMWSVTGVFGRLALKMSWAEALRMTAAEPGELAGALAESLHDALVDVRAGIAAGVDVILVADDLAGATGPLVAPDYSLEALMPCYRRIAHTAIAEGVPAVFHSDGDVRVLMPSLARAGFSAMHLAGITEEAWLASYSAARGEGMAVLGGIEAMSVAHGVRRAGERAARFALADGLLVCDDGGITSAEEVVALTAAIDVARKAYAAGATD